MAVGNVAARSIAGDLSGLLDSPEIAALIDELEALRWTGRKGYPTRALVGACLAKSLYAIPTWSRTAALIAEHTALRNTLGAAPSVYACYRFQNKLRKHKPLLDACIGRVTTALRTDSDASWGHRSAVSTRKGGGFYGYKLQAAVCARTELPVAWQVETAKHHESQFALPLLDAACARGFQPETCAMDKGYDSRALHDGFEERDCRPIIAQIRARNAVTRDDVPTCEHGRWTFAGADFKRKATKWRCPFGECQPKSVWLAADRRNPLIPRSTKRFGDLYRGRGAVERAFGRLKDEYGLKPLRTRGIERVALHTDLCILATLASALARARAVPLAA